MFNKEKCETKKDLTVTTWRINYILMIFKVIDELPSSVDTRENWDFLSFLPFSQKLRGSRDFFFFLNLCSCEAVPHIKTEILNLGHSIAQWWVEQEIRSVSWKRGNTYSLLLIFQNHRIMGHITCSTTLSLVDNDGKYFRLQICTHLLYDSSQFILSSWHI